MATLRDWISRRLPSGFTRDVAVLTAGNVGGQLISVLAIPILARLYSPSEYGIFAVYSSILALLHVNVALRYEIAIPAVRGERQLLAVTGVSFAAVLLTSVVVALVAIPVSFWGDVYLPSIPFLHYAWILPVALLTSGIGTVLTWFAIRRGAIIDLAYTRIAQGFTGVAAQALFALFGFGAAGLLLGDALARLVGAIRLGLPLRRCWKERQVAIGVRTVIAAARHHRGFAIVAGPAGLMNAIVLQLPTLLIGGFFGKEAVGWYSMTQRVLGAPVGLVGQAIGRAFTGHFAQRMREESSDLTTFFDLCVKRLAMYGTGPILLIGAVSPWLLPVVLGEIWRPAGWLTLASTPMFVAGFIISPLSPVLLMINRHRIQLLWDAVRLGALLLTFAFVIRSGFSLLWLICGISAVMAGAYLWLHALCRRALAHRRQSMEDRTRVALSVEAAEPSDSNIG